MKTTFNGNPVNLNGEQLNAGEGFPNFAATANDMSTITLSDTKGKRLFLSVPSIDMSVCDLEVRTINQRISELSDVEAWVVTMDLPFAQKRWCAAADMDSINTISDYKDRSFSIATGTLVKELGLLAGAVFVVDEVGIITYCEYVPEITAQPDFDAALHALKRLALPYAKPRLSAGFMHYTG